MAAGRCRISAHIIKPPSPEGHPIGWGGVDPRPWWAGPLEMVLPVLLTVGLLLPSDGEWRQVLEVALLPILGWYAWRYGLGGRRAVYFLAVPIAWISWLGLSGGWGSEEVRAEWDNTSMAAVQTGAFFLLCTIVVRVTPRRRLEGIAAAFVLAAAWALIRGLGEHVADHGASLVPRLDNRGLFSNPNRAAALACLMLLFAMHLATSARNTFLRVIALLYMPLAAVYLVFTGSRGGFVMFIATILAFLVVSGGKVAAMRFLVVTGLTFVLALAALLLFPATGEQVWDNLSRNVYRMAIWQETWSVAMERPLLGHGYGFDERVLGMFVHPHNLHLSNLLYGGFPALALGLATLGTAAWKAATLPDRRCRALVVAAVVLVVIWTIPNGGVPVSKPNDDWYHFWLPIALASGLALRSGRSASTAQPASQ